MTKDIALSLHSLIREGSERVHHEDLVGLAEAFPDMLPVLEEVQWLRREYDACLEREREYRSD